MIAAGLAATEVAFLAWRAGPGSDLGGLGDEDLAATHRALTGLVDVVEAARLTTRGLLTRRLIDASHGQPPDTRDLHEPYVSDGTPAMVLADAARRFIGHSIYGLPADVMQSITTEWAGDGWQTIARWAGLPLPDEDVIVAAIGWLTPPTGDR